MSADQVVIVAAVGLGGFGLGVGLVVGAFVARSLRRYMSGEFPRDGRPGK